MSDPLERAAELAAETPTPAAAIYRQIRSEYGSEAPSLKRVGRAVREARIRPPTQQTRDPAVMADRIMRLLDRELAALERQSGKLDLDRLDKLAATIRRIEPIRPKGEGRKTASLRSLITEGDLASDGDGDLSEAEPET